MTKRIYAVAETVPARSKRTWTPGKRYLLTHSEHWGTDECGESSMGFSIVCDYGDMQFCLWKGCAHLEGGNWTRIEEESDDA